ncbi:MAG: class I SAM-dependent methyltransferase [Gemmatimonadetes bacterium]|nr:class I SAM-dependent methyltransferase [Gemmatimonadota bacterium]
MTSVGLLSNLGAAPALAGRESAGSRASEQERGYVLIYDRLQPCLVDYSPFAKVISDVAGAYGERARMIELGCGTGLLAYDVLAAAGNLDYLGLDASRVMVDLFAQKAAGLPQAGRTISFAAPADPRRKGTMAALQAEAADFVVMSQLLQSLPPAPVATTDLIDRVGLLMSAGRLVRPGGKLFVIEEVFGESVEEHALLVNEWHAAAAERLRAQAVEIHAALRGVDPALLDQLTKIPSQATLVRWLRERLWRYGEPQILPLSAWCALFGHLRLRYRALPHPTLRNFYLFVIDKV